MAIEAGTRLLHYRLIEKIGEGGMGVVWKAVDTSLDREVAIKILPEAFAADAERLGRFQREARLLASLNHARIAAVYGLHEAATPTGTIRFLAMELVPGEDLSVRLERGPLPLDDAVRIARQVAEALEAAHGQGVIHRDLKPANVVLTSDGSVKVLDFGLAKALEGGPSGSDPSASPTVTSAGTLAGVILGTAAYMSPEQAKGRTLDRRTDVWSFGVTLFEMITGRCPYRGDTVSETLAEVLKGEPDWDTLPPATSPALRRLLRRCLVRDPAWRLSDMGDARIELRAAEEGEEEPGVAASPLEAAAAPSPSRRWTWTLAAVAVVAVSAAAWFALRPGAQVPRPQIRFTIHHPDEARVTISNPAVSPDGRFVVYVANDQGVQRLWVRELDAAEPRVLPGTDAAEKPFVSPDSRWIGFFTAGTLKKVAVSGGTPVEIGDVGARYNPGAAWGPDGRILFSRHWTTGLSAVPEDGGTVEDITTIDTAAGETGHWWPELLPVGDKVLYTVFTVEGTLNRARIALLDLRTGKSTTVGPGAQALFVSSPDGDRLLYHRAGVYEIAPFDAALGELTGPPETVLDDVPPLDPAGASTRFLSVSHAGVMAWVTRRNDVHSAPRRWFWIDRDGRLEPVPLPAGTLKDPALSPDGRRLAVVRAVEGEYDVFVHDLESGTETRITTDSINTVPGWSPSGTHVAYQTLELGTFDVFWREVDGAGAAEPLVTAEGDVYLGGFTPDGTRVVVNKPSETGDEIFVHDLDSGELRLFAAIPGDEDEPKVSPDGRLITYSSNPSGVFEVYVVPIANGGAPVKVSRHGGTSPEWAAGGSRLVFDAGREILVADIAFEGGRVRVGRPEPFVASGWTDDLAARYSGQYAVSPDGRRLLIALLDEPPRGRVEVVLDGPASLPGAGR